MNPDDFEMQKIFESGALAFNMGPQAGDFADYSQSNLTVLKPSEKDEKKHTVEIGGKSYDLSSDELSLLKFITQHKGDDEENEEDYNNVLKRALAICSNQKAKYKEELSNYREGFDTAPAPQDDELASYVSPDSTKLNQTLQDIGDKLYDELLNQLRYHSSKFGDIMKQAHGDQLNQIIDAVAQSMKDKDKGNPLPHTQIPGPDGPGTVRGGDGRIYHMKGSNQ